MELSEEFKAKALLELREDDARKSQSLEQFREWISKQVHIKKCRTDDIFLLRFLRVKKYSNAETFKMLEKFLVSCQTHPQWFKNLTFDDDRMRELYESGYIFPLKERDRNGCRVVFIQASKLDAKKFTFAEVFKILNLVIFTLLEEPETQIAGIVYIIDHKDISLDYIALFSLIDLRNYLKCIQNAVPCRQKQGIWLNLPSFAVKITDFAKSLVSAKLRQRAFFYKGMENIFGHVDPSILPKEYGGQTPIKDLMEDFRVLAELRKEKLKQIDAHQIDIEGVKGHEAEVGGSFRKLEID